MTAKIRFNTGDSVVVKPNVKDPDTGTDIGGSQGRICEIDNEGLVAVEWDSVTLKNLSASSIAKSEKEGLDWTTMYLDGPELVAASARDTEEDVAEAIRELSKEHAWDDLGEEGKRIATVLAGVDPDDDWEAKNAWRTHLGMVLSCPLQASVAEFQETGPLKEGDEVRVEGINDVDDTYGVLVDARVGRRKYVFPLCDLKPADQHSPNHQPLQDYATWC